MTTRSNKGVIKINFKDTYIGIYKNIHFEIRLSGSQIRFYEVNTEEKKEYNLTKDTVKWLMSNSRLPRTKLMKKAVKGDKSIFN
jgi:hypothetical protein